MQHLIQLLSDPQVINTILGGVAGLVLAIFNWLINRKHLSEIDNLRKQVEQKDAWLKEVYTQLDECLDNKPIREDRQ